MRYFLPLQRYGPETPSSFLIGPSALKDDKDDDRGLVVHLAQISDRERDQSPKEDDQTRRFSAQGLFELLRCNHCVLDTGFMIRDVTV